jgi:hypothetical protein
MAHLERQKSYDRSSDDCREGLLDVFADLHVVLTRAKRPAARAHADPETVAIPCPNCAYPVPSQRANCPSCGAPTSDEAAAKPAGADLAPDSPPDRPVPALKGTWHSLEKNLDLPVEATCVSPDGKSTVVTVAYHNPGQVFVSNDVVPMLEGVLAALDVRLSDAAPVRPPVLETIAAAERALDASGPPLCDECGGPATGGVECRWVIGRLLSERSVGSEIVREFGDYTPVRANLCGACLVRKRRSYRRTLGTLLACSVVAVGAWLPLMNAVAGPNLDRSARGVLAAVTVLLVLAPLVLGSAIAWTWRHSGKPAESAELLAGYRRRKVCVPPGTRYTTWTREEFEALARERRWR